MDLERVILIFFEVDGLVAESSINKCEFNKLYGEVRCRD